MRRSSVHYFAAAVHTFIATCIYNNIYVAIISRADCLHTSALHVLLGLLHMPLYNGSVVWLCKHTFST